MPHILFLIFSASTATGPTHVGMHSMEFQNLEACMAAVKTIDEATRSYRVAWSKTDTRCIPKSIEKPAP